MSVLKTVKYGFELIYEHPIVLLPYVFVVALNALIQFLAPLTPLTFQLAVIVLPNKILVPQVLRSEVSVGTSIYSVIAAFAFNSPLGLWAPALRAALVFVESLVGVFFVGIYISIAQQGFHDEVSIRKALRIARENYALLLATSTLIAITLFIFESLIAGALSIWAVATGAGFLNTAWLQLLVVAWLLATIAGLLIYAMFFQAMPVAVFENKPPIAALRRSWEIGKKDFWEIVAVLLVSLLIIALFRELVYYILYHFVSQHLAVGLNYILLVFFGAWYSTVSVSFYHNYVSKK